MLRVLVDGVALPEAEAREFWARFSAHLDAHKGDLKGFAAAEGFASVHPETRGGEPSLIVSRTEAQRAYTHAPSRGTGPPSSAPGGSRAPQRGGAEGKPKANHRQKKR